MTSPDGVTWTVRTTSSAVYLQDIAWSPELGILVAIGNLSGTSYSIYSYNGISWTIGSIATSTAIKNICWSSELGYFVVLGETLKTFKSTDGINWTSYTSNYTFGYTRFCWAAEMGVFASTPAAPLSTNMVTSLDGVTWTLSTTAISGGPAISGVCWSPELGRFFLGVSYSSSAVPYWSSDGITLVSTGQTYSGIGGWQHPTWIPELSLIIFESRGSQGSTLLSHDGINWYTKAQSMFGVCYAPELGIMVYNGTASANVTFTALSLTRKA
jgi:hypothetical protein